MAHSFKMIQIIFNYLILISTYTLYVLAIIALILFIKCMLRYLKNK